MKRTGSDITAGRGLSVEGEPAEAPKFGFHPHSGIATLTLILSGQVTYKETTDCEGIIETGGVEWMRASSGVWHTGGVAGTERIKGFQLWVAMPETAPGRATRPT